MINHSNKKKKKKWNDSVNIEYYTNCFIVVYIEDYRDTIEKENCVMPRA